MRVRILEVESRCFYQEFSYADRIAVTKHLSLHHHPLIVCLGSVTQQPAKVTVQSMVSKY